MYKKEEISKTLLTRCQMCVNGGQNKFPDCLDFDPTKDCYYFDDINDIARVHRMDLYEHLGTQKERKSRVFSSHRCRTNSLEIWRNVSIFAFNLFEDRPCQCCLK